MLRGSSFKSHLAGLILKGEKNTTHRLFDDKALKEGDQVNLINKNTLEKFAEAKLIKVYEKTLGTLTGADWEGHEKFSSDEEMYETYKKYYSDKIIDKNTVVKIIRFEIV